MVVSTELKKSEGTFINAVDEGGVDAVQISNYYASSLESHFHALDILPQCDNRIAMVELSKVSMLVCIGDLLSMIRKIRNNQLTRNTGINRV
jgi:hypothetical protein